MMRKLFSITIVTFAILTVLIPGVQAALDVGKTGAYFEPKEFDPAGIYGPNSTILKLYLTEPATVTVIVRQGGYYWTEPEVVRHLVIKKKMPAGWNSVVWDGRDDKGKIVPREDDYSVPYVAIIMIQDLIGEWTWAKARVLVMGTG